MSFAQPATVDDLLNYRLSCLLASSGAMVTRLCEGRYGITRREWRLIAILAAHGAMSPSDLAARAHLERARISRHIAELVAKKLVARVGIPEDKRRARVELNERGRTLYEELFPQSVGFNNMVLQALSPDEVAAFDNALTRLTEVAEQLSHSHPVVVKADRRHGGSRRFLKSERADGSWWMNSHEVPPWPSR
jgi:DNA-binding MarR family transcriptional regulator